MLENGGVEWAFVSQDNAPLFRLDPGEAMQVLMAMVASPESVEKNDWPVVSKKLILITVRREDWEKYATNAANSIKIGLADLAKRQGCSVDYLLAQAEADNLKLFARIKPLSADLKAINGDPLPTIDEHGKPLLIFGPRTIKCSSYTVLLPNEATALRGGDSVTIKVLREDGHENGPTIPQFGESCPMWFLSEPQIVGIDDVCVNDDMQAVAQPSRELAKTEESPIDASRERPSAANAPTTAKNTDGSWNKDALRAEFAALKKAGSKSPTKDLAEKYGVSETVIKNQKMDRGAKTKPAAVSNAGWADSLKK